MLHFSTVLNICLFVPTTLRLLYIQVIAQLGDGKVLTAYSPGWTPVFQCQQSLPFIICTVAVEEAILVSVWCPAGSSCYNILYLQALS